MLDYKQLEEELKIACNEVNEAFLQRFNNGAYISAGGAKLDSFLSELQQEFEFVAQNFIINKGLQHDPDSKKRVRTITRLFAKSCIEQFSRYGDIKK